MLCPYCLTEVHLDDSLYAFGRVSREEINLPEWNGTGVHWFCGMHCPKCRGAIVVHKNIVNTERVARLGVRIDESDDIVYPRNSALSPLPAEVPAEYRSDFDEARLVMKLSPKSSAALSRRLLQMVLQNQFCMKAPNLQQEIQQFIAQLGPPSHLAQHLDAVRVVGNFAAHPMKDTNTGLITDVEDGEADLLIETLESLFDYAFVQPARWANAKTALNAKLRAAGKPELR